MRPFLALLRRDLRLALREGGALGTSLGFYLVVASLVPLGVGPNLPLLARIAPGILWVALLLAALLSANRMFEADEIDGTLETLATGPLALEGVAAAKCIAHWVSCSLPLTLAAPLLGLMLNLDIAEFPALIASMLAGTPAVSFIGGIGAAMTLKARRAGLLLALIVLPLYVPTLVFGVLAVGGSQFEGAFWPPFLLQLAVSLVSMVLAPLATAAALRAILQ
jgi:heme exporter protein B